ncbi:MAG: hypothetical protein PHZ02_07160 [Desulfocapsaceae bacterium]|nr:hypothetical protein [Desulfocapsaceae bacterium]
MQERISRLMAVASASDKLELVILNNGYVAATKENQKLSTKESLNRWRGIRTELAGYLNKLEGKYFPGDEMPESFKTKKEVLGYLQEDGWQIGQSQFYKHCRDMLLRPEKEGGYSLNAVKKYAAINLRRTETGQKVNDKLDRMQEERLEVELETAKVKLTREQHDLGVKQSKFIPRDDFELAIVARAVAFMAHLNHTIQSSVPDWIDVVGGNQDRAPDLVAAISEAIEQRMGDFAADVEFDVILEAN